MRKQFLASRHTGDPDPLRDMGGMAQDENPPAIFIEFTTQGLVLDAEIQAPPRFAGPGTDHLFGKDGDVSVRLNVHIKY